MNSNKKKDDFFGLNSESDNDDSDQANSSKWDWENPVNRDIYFKQNNSNNSQKRRNDDFYDKFQVTKKSSQDSTIDKNYHNSPYTFRFLINAHSNCINRIYWNSQTSYSNLLLSSSLDKTIKIWNINQQYKLQKTILGHTEAVRNAIWSLNGTEIASISYDYSCLLSNAETGDDISKQRINEIPSAIVPHPHNPNIYLIGSKNIIYTWDSRTNNTIKQYKLQMGQVQDLLFINEKEFISSGDVVARESAHLAVVVWDFDSQASLSNQIFHEKYVCTCLKKHPLNNLFYAQTHGNYIAEFSARNPYRMNKNRRFQLHQTAGYNIGFDVNDNGYEIASGSVNGLIYFYHTNSGKIIYKIDAFKNEFNQPCMDVKFNPTNKNTIAVSSWNGKIKLFDKF